MVDPFVQYAQRIIKGYLAKKGESLKWLSKQTGVAYHKVYRTENGEIKALSYFDAKPLLQFIEPDCAAETLRKFFPTESESQNPQLSFEDLKRQERLIDFVMEDGARLPIFIHVHTKSGVRYEEIKEYFGLAGLDVLNALIRMEVLSLSAQDELVSNVDKERTLSERSAKCEARAQINILNFDNKGAYIRSEQRRYNTTGTLAVYNAISQCSEELRRIDSDPSYAGDQVYVYTLAVGTLRGGVSDEK